MENGWKARNGGKGSYRARSISHESNSSIEYGEKTWTTAQTVRDLMQNHLDAETERYFEKIADTLFSKEDLESLRGAEISLRSRVEDLLHASYLYAKHSGDMSDESRLVSINHLSALATDLSVRAEVMHDGVFQADSFHTATSAYTEEPPYVAYEIIDTANGTSAGWVPHEALSTEELYQERRSGSYRYALAGMKVVDRGTGYDSQLSSLFLSSKTGKRHLRGKFGEGAKMSELQVLRGGATLKMRSHYQSVDDQENVRSRTWQVRPGINEEGRMVAKGVEVEGPASPDTGSTFILSFKNAKENFKEELIQNIDPRIGGLGMNVAEYGAHDFTYPMPVTQPHLAGVNVEGNGEVQFVQGLRVELAKDSFGYSTPWYSYDFLDSSIIAGRDRNELTGGISERINEFWKVCDSTSLLERLIIDTVHNSSKHRNNLEEDALGRMLSNISDFRRESPEVEALRVRRHELIDSILLRELQLEPGVPTLVTGVDENNPYDEDGNIRAVFQYARRNGFRIKKIAHDIGSIEDFAKRIGGEYEIYGFNDVQNRMYEQRRMRIKAPEIMRDPREESFIPVFEKALATVNMFARMTSLQEVNLQLKFSLPRRGGDRGSYDSDDYESYEDRGRYGSEPVTFDYGTGVEVDLDAIGYYNGRESQVEKRLVLYLLGKLQIPDAEAPDQYYEPHRSVGSFEDEQMDWFGDPFEREIEVSNYRGHDTDPTDSPLKDSQHVLDYALTKLIPEDSNLLSAIPSDLEYIKDFAVLDRILTLLLEDNVEKSLEEYEKTFESYKRAMSADLTKEEAEAVLAERDKNRNYSTRSLIKAKVFPEGDTLYFYNKRTDELQTTTLSEQTKVTEWLSHPVYRIDDGRYFVPLPMPPGAVLSKGEGKKREYFFRDGEAYLHIGDGASYWGSGYSKEFQILPKGLVLPALSERGYRSSSEKEEVMAMLSEYTYFPHGSKRREGKIVSGTQETSIPIEYGKDEWDNPVRVFQDIVQNHIDASGGAPLALQYEIERSGQRLFLTEKEIEPADTIVGFSVEDTGDGYYPNDIATLGTSSKRSPLFAGKYGEGQKMVAAAALRSGLELTYASNVAEESGSRSWLARATTVGKKVVLGGRSVDKEIVAFDVEPQTIERRGSKTTIRLGEDPGAPQKDEWNAWIAIIDPRQKDKQGHAGLARYVRQLREPGSERTTTVGSISILLDEPGAVYENGLRINAAAEGSRSLALGYDVPEVVHTRERNSFNAGRLQGYAEHAISHIEDPAVIAEILEKIAQNKRGSDLSIGRIANSESSPVALWAKEARRIWPGYVVYSPQRIEEIIHPRFPSDNDGIWYARDLREAYKVRANLVHLNASKILNVSKQDYSGFSKLLPTAESVIERLETELLPVSSETNEMLSNVVAHSAQLFKNLQIHIDSEKPNSLLSSALQNIDEEGKQFWMDAENIAREGKVGIAPISAGYHGMADNGVIFNESLLLPGRNRDLAETALHEVAHLLTDERDYTEGFVEALYEMALFLGKKSGSLAN